MRSHSKSVLALRLFLPVLVWSAAAQTPFVKITSPAPGTLVHPGSRLPITVDATPGAFSRVLVPPLTIATSGPPYHLVYEVPSDVPGSSTALPSGVYPVEVVGLPASGSRNRSEKDAVKDFVEIDIERSASPERLKSKLGDLYEVQDEFHHIGEVQKLWITGLFADGTNVDLSRSRLTIYESSAPSVATVDDKGVVTAVGPGSATITVKNGKASIVVPITVPDKY